MKSRAIASGVTNAPHILAYYDAFEEMLNDINLAVILIQLIDLAPSAALPFLAMQFDVVGLKGYQFCTTDPQRRGLLKSAIDIKRLGGTPAAIERAIIAVGFKNALVTERTGIKHNGTYKYNGSKRHGGTLWYNLDIEVFYTGATPSVADEILITNLVNIYKASRSVLFNLKFTLTP